MVDGWQCSPATSRTAVASYLYPHPFPRVKQRVRSVERPAHLAERKLAGRTTPRCPLRRNDTRQPNMALERVMLYTPPLSLLCGQDSGHGAWPKRSGIQSKASQPREHYTTMKCRAGFGVPFRARPPRKGKNRNISLSSRKMDRKVSLRLPEHPKRRGKYWRCIVALLAGGKILVSHSPCIAHLFDRRENPGGKALFLKAVTWLDFTASCQVRWRSKPTN